MKVNIKQIAVFSLLGVIMFVSKIVLEFLPNVHLLATFTVAYTAVYRQRALYPIAVYILLNGLYAGFAPWWIPYIYIWPLLWLITMFLPKKMSPKTATAVYCTVCALHGFTFSIMYSPFQALFYGLSFKGTIAWIIAGIPFDTVMGISNIFCALLILPIIKALKQTEKLTNQER